MMMCTYCMSRVLWVFIIIIIFIIFVKFIGNKKKLEKSDGTDDDVYTLHV
jgi:uncharacterized membrane protein